MKGQEINHIRDLAACLSNKETFIQGNSELLTELFKEHFKTEKPRVCFFGDQYTNDVYFAATNPGWDGIVIIEELALAGHDYDEIEKSSPLGELDPKLYKLNSYWGSDFIVHEWENPVVNYFVDQA